jgi:hypothetical protein
MSLRFGTFLMLAAASPLQASEPLNELSLVCDGTFRGDFKDQGIGAIVVDSDGNSASARGTTSKYREIPTRALFELKGSVARLNLPQPPTCAICVGEKGWREVKDLEVGSDRISGRIKYGLFSATEFEIDRRTGLMTSRNGFSGNCEAVDLSKRKF